MTELGRKLSPGAVTEGLYVSLMEPTLFVELVDRTDPGNPVTLYRRPVSVRVDTDDDFKTIFEGRPGFKIVGGDVDGGHQLDIGDVVVAYDWDEPSSVWLAEVVEATGFPAERFYTITSRATTTRAQWVTRNNDTRWDAWNVDSGH